MSKQEVHQTVSELRVEERVASDLEITEEEYRSEFDVSGRLDVVAKPDKRAVRDRERRPRHVLDAVRSLVDAEGGNVFGRDAYPGTGMYLGVSNQLPADESWTDRVEVDGLPENGTVEFDVDWDATDAQRVLADNDASVFTHEYEIASYPRDRLPIVVRARLYRDAVELVRDDDGSGEENDNLRRRQELEGLAALLIEIEHRDVRDGGRLELSTLKIDMSRTFPQIDFDPKRDATYDPENKRVEWRDRTASPGETTQYVVLGPITELLDIGEVTATLQGKVRNRTLSGTRIEGAYDASGAPFVDTARVDVDHVVELSYDIHIDTRALSGEATKTTRSSITVSTTPTDLYDELVSICRQEGIQIRRQKAVGEAEPAADREALFRVEDENRGELAIKREYGDEGVVHAEITVEGVFTPQSERSEVSAFSDSEDRLVRADEGALGENGRATAEVVARSASSELNSRLIGTLEGAFNRGGSQ
jgi:hypothetical protein